MAARSTRKGNGTKVYDFESHSSRIVSIIDAIVGSRKMMVVSGSEVLDASGMQLETSGKSDSGAEMEVPATLGDLIKECLTVDLKVEEVRDDKLQIFNQAMTRRRVESRCLAPVPFYTFLRRAFDRGRLLGCLSDNLDGLETQGHAAMESILVMMRGDNRKLRCRTAGCPGLAGQEVIDLDAQLLRGEDISCPRCTRDHVSLSLRLRSTRFLRPAIRGRIDSDLLPGGNLRRDLLRAAHQSDLLLVAGVSMQSEYTYNLLYSLGERVRKNGGAVVYIGETPLKGRETNSWIHFHLKVDIEECAARILKAMELAGAEDDADGDSLVNGTDVWYDVMQNELEPQATLERPEPTSRRCLLCNLEMSEFWVSCTTCQEAFCCRGLGQEFIGDMCVELNAYATGPHLLNLEEEKQLFKCPFCWHDENHPPLQKLLYPHYIRPVPIISIERPGEDAPRMVMVIYYLEEFWPQAMHLRSLVTARWKTNGWPRASALSSQSNYKLLTNKKSLWSNKSFDLFFVYLTHGLSESKGYQISHNVSCVAVEENRSSSSAQRRQCNTLSTAPTLPGQSWFAVATLSRLLNTQEICISGSGVLLTRNGPFDSLLGCMNLKLAPAFMLNLVTKMTTKLAKVDQWAEEKMLECWLTDGIACNHTDMLLLTKRSPPVMWLFAPFESRPLGKELPSLLSVCSCPQLSTSRTDPAEGWNRKVWRVTHDWKKGKPLNEVIVKASCSVCGQMWLLPSEHLAGSLRRVDGLFAAVVPYFSP
ncbi:hypothetical protein BDV93DRAFT_513684 [Ceratobasidium sp. AG-I]|nr:hypothetical protein BDV93DRAFT_513684 [Ceratobasidium sp. AG-I]